jgi:hypothetical protein
MLELTSQAAFDRWHDYVWAKRHGNMAAAAEAAEDMRMYDRKGLVPPTLKKRYPEVFGYQKEENNEHSK